MAPESLRRPMKFSTKTDVWSFGVMTYEIFNCGMKPWPDEPPKKIATMIRKCQMPQMPDRAPEEIKSMVAKIWVLDPTQRPTMKHICSLLFAASRKHPAPPAEKFTLNTIKGVSRISPDSLATMEETMTVDEEADLHYKSATIEKTLEPDVHTESRKVLAEESARGRLRSRKRPKR